MGVTSIIRFVFRKKSAFLIALLACVLWGCNSSLPASTSDPGTGSTEFAAPVSTTEVVSTDVMETIAVSTSTPDSTSTHQPEQFSSDVLTPGLYIVYTEEGNNEDGISNEILIAALIDGNEKITLYNGELGSPSLSPTDYQVAYSVRTGIFIRDLETNSTTQVPGSGECTGPEWSPDGTMLAFDCHDDNGKSVYIYSLDSQQYFPVLPHPPILQSGGPVWSPDGKWLAYQAGQFRSGVEPEFNGIYITSVESILENEIPSHINTRGPVSDSYLYSWTSDEEYLAYLSQINEISLYNIKAWSSRVLFTIEQDIKDFVCSPEGDWIALRTISGIYITPLNDSGELTVIARTYTGTKHYLNFWMIVE